MKLRRIFIALLFIFLVVFFIGCQTNIAPAELQIIGLLPGFEEGMISSYEVKDNSAYFEVNGKSIKLSPFIKADFLRDKDLYLKATTSFAPDGVRRYLEFLIGQKTVLIVVDNAGRNSRFLDGFLIKEGKIIKEDQPQKRKWMELAIVTPQNEKFTARQGVVLEIQSLGEKWGFLLVGSYLNDLNKKDIAEEKPDFVADYIVFKK